MTEYQLAAKRVLHGLEIELSTKVGVLEHDLGLIDVVAALLEYEEIGVEAELAEGKCNCKCRICQMAEHGEE